MLSLPLLSLRPGEINWLRFDAQLDISLRVRPKYLVLVAHNIWLIAFVRLPGCLCTPHLLDALIVFAACTLFSSTVVGNEGEKHQRTAFVRRPMSTLARRTAIPDLCPAKHQIFCTRTTSNQTGAPAYQFTTRAPLELIRDRLPCGTALAATLTKDERHGLLVAPNPSNNLRCFPKILREPEIVLSSLGSIP